MKHYCKVCKNEISEADNTVEALSIREQATNYSYDYLSKRFNFDAQQVFPKLMYCEKCAKEYVSQVEEVKRLNNYYKENFPYCMFYRKRNKHNTAVSIGVIAIICASISIFLSMVVLLFK